MKVRLNIDIDTDDEDDRFLLEEILYTLQQFRGDTYGDDTGSEGQEESS
mgnify:FL=1